MSYLPPTASQQADMDACVARVTQDFTAWATFNAGQQGTVNGGLNLLFTGWGGGESDAVAASANAYSLLQPKSVVWAGDDYQSVLTGDMDMANWFATGKAFHDASASTVADVGQWNWSGVASQTATQTAKDIGTAAKAASAAVVESTWPVLAIAGAFLVLVLLIKVS